MMNNTAGKGRWWVGELGHKYPCFIVCHQLLCEYGNRKPHGKSARCKQEVTKPIC